MTTSRKICVGLCALIAATAMVTSAQAAYKQANAPLMTFWGEKMTPETAWRLHPRPNLERSAWENLNGMWKYAITPANVMQKPTAWDGEILVPFAVESALSGVGRAIQPNEAIWYQRSFQVNDLKGNRLLLHFDGVDFRSQVFVNGKEVTDYPHEGGLLPYTVDITDAVRAGDNSLMLAVWDPTDTWQNATGKQVLKPGGIMYTATSGIWQTVWTEQVPATYVTGYEVDSDIDAGIAYIKLRTEGNLYGASATVTAKDPNGKVVAKGSVKDWTKPVALKIKNAQLWSPDNPNLYTMDIALKSSNGTDNVQGYFGMRKIEMKKDNNGVQSFFLNNEKIYMLGTLDQGWWPDGLLTPPSEEAMKFDIQFLKDAGFNMMRKHIKVEPMRYYYLCDKMGIMVWQDMASGPGDVNARYGMYRRELKNMIDFLQPIPSIVVWVPYNEGWGEQKAFMANSTLSWVMDYDKTRLVDGPSGWTDYGVGHTKDMHNYPGPGMFPLMENRISVLGEFGGLGLVIPDHVWAANKGWGYVSDSNRDESFSRYTSLMNRLARLAGSGLAASVYTQTTDVEVENNGLLTYDRKVDKYGKENLKKIHEKVYEGVTAQYNAVVLKDKGAEWKYTFEKPADTWMNVDFDDAAWRTGKAGFGNAVIKKDHAQAKVQTDWENPDGIWMRSEFQWDGKDFDIATLNMFYDENPVIYVNGIQVASISNWNGGYNEVDVDNDAFKKAVRNGKNVIAIKADNKNGGGAYIDLAVIVLIKK